MIELLNLWQLQSESVAAAQNVNSLFVIYVVLSVIVKRPALLLAYISTELLFQLAFFDVLQEWNLYAIECIIYTYILFTIKTRKGKLACLSIVISSAYFVYDAYSSGASETHQGIATFAYENISLVFTSAHILLICSFISISRIRLCLRSFINSVTRMSPASDYLMVCWYNISMVYKK